MSPLAYVPSFRCIGLNYAKHAAETNMPIPKYPILFMKPAGALQDPFRPVVVPAIAENKQADWESELAVVIGKKCKNVKEEEALQYVLGKLCRGSSLICHASRMNINSVMFTRSGLTLSSSSSFPSSFFSFLFNLF